MYQKCASNHGNGKFLRERKKKTGNNNQGNIGTGKWKHRGTSILMNSLGNEKFPRERKNIILFKNYKRVIKHVFLLLLFISQLETMFIIFK